MTTKIMPSALSLKNISNEVISKKDKRAYTDEFRAVVLSEADNIGIRAAANQFGVSEATLYEWRARRDGKSKKPVQTHREPVQASINVIQEALKMLKGQAESLDAQAQELTNRLKAVESQRAQISAIVNTNWFTSASPPPQGTVTPSGIGRARMHGHDAGTAEQI